MFLGRAAALVFLVGTCRRGHPRRDVHGQGFWLGVRVPPRHQVRMRAHEALELALVVPANGHRETDARRTTVL